MDLLRDILREQDEDTSFNAHAEEFATHARNLGLNVRGGNSFVMAFVMRDADTFDINFQIDADQPNKVNVNYILGEGKQYNVKIPLERFLKFTKNELSGLHEELKEYQEEYQSAVKIVKQMPKRIRSTIEQKVK